MMMESNRSDGDQTRVPDEEPSQLRYSPPPPPPAAPPGWLFHVPAIEPDQLPRAPTSFTFGTGLSTNDSDLPNTLSSSSSFNQYLQLHHPTYAPPDAAGLTYDHEQSTSESYRALSRDPSPSSAATALQPASIPALTTSFSSRTNSNNLAHSVSPLHPDIAPDPLNSPRNDDSWQPELNTTRLPPTPQDVEYSSDLFQSPHVLVSELSQSHLLMNGTHDTLPTKNAPNVESNHVTSIEGDDMEDEIDPTLRWLDSSRKRAWSEALLLEEDNADIRTQGSKRPRNSASLAKTNDNPSVGANHTNDGPATTKPRKEPRGRGRPKGQKVGPRPTLDPGPEFMNLYNQAMDAFIEENDVLTAQTKVLQAIGANPEIFAAHSLLADIHFAKGDHEKGLDALIGGLHAHMNDVELWREVADTILVDNHEASQKRLERAMYCFGGILRKDPKDMDARFQRAECARLLGHVNRAFGDLNILLQDDPHNSTVLAQFTKLCSDVDDPSKAKFMYEEHFDFYKVNGMSESDCFTWQDIGVYVDLMAQLGETAQAIVMLKRLSRWLCGRRDEDFWEEYLEDDREFDQNHYPRRLEASQFEPNKYPEQDYGEALPLDMRAKLGILRLKLNYREEAQSHFEWLEADLETGDSIVDEYSDTFLEIAKALHDVKEHKEALRFYGALEEAGIDLGFDFWIGLGASAYVCEQREKAIEAYEQALVVNPNSVEARTQLTKLYRDMGDRINALKYGREAVVMSQDAIPVTGNRKYESRENRLLREAAERALRGAYRLPVKPHGAQGKVPDSLKYRTRYKSKFTKYVPRQTEEPQSESINEDERPSRSRKERPKKAGPHKKKGRPAKPVEDVGLKTSKETGRTSVTGEDIAENAERPSKDKGAGAKRSSRPYRKPPSKVDPQKHCEDLQTLYRTLLKHQPAMRDGDSEATSHWIDCARAMVDDFRTVKVFFPGERHKKFDGYPATVAKPRTSSSRPVSVEPSPRPSQSVHPSSMDMAAEKSRSATPVRLVDKNVPNEYCDIPFPVWLDIFLELALITANAASFQSGERDLQTDCYSIINAALDCNVFYHHAPSLAQIYTVYLSCCLALNDDVTLYNTVLRWFMNEFAFCTDTYRLYSAVALVGEYANLEGKSRIDGSMYRDSSNQKYLFRQLCSIDQQLPKHYGIGTDFGPVPSFMRRERDGLRKKQGNDGDTQLARNTPVQSPSADMLGQSAPPSADKTPNPHTKPVPVGSISRRDRLGNPIGLKSFSPKEMDVVLFILYSHIMMANNSFTNALNYLYRAHSLDPSNTVCLLSMAFCYLTELFKRQVSNRHALSLMGWVWFGRYEDERRNWAKQMDERHESAGVDGDQNNTVRDKMKMIDLVNREIEFNKARCWEMLGMADLAVRGYRKVLALPTTKRGKPGNDNYDDGSHDIDDIEEEPETFDMEAAYALSTIYMINGNGQKAREVAEKYMVVE